MLPSILFDARLRPHTRKERRQRNIRISVTSLISVFHLYHFHNFEEAVVIDLRAELAKGKHESRIRDLFDESFAAQTYRVQWEGSRRTRRGKPWYVANLKSMIALVVGMLAGGIVVGKLRRKRALPENSD